MDPPLRSQSRTATAFINQKPELSRLKGLLRETELGFKLDQSRFVTYFAPSNEAIEEAGLDKILEHLTYDDVMSILYNHVVPQVIRGEGLAPGDYEFTTLGGSTLELQKREEANDLMVMRAADDTAFRVSEAMESANGPIYIVSKLFVPKELEGKLLLAREEVMERDAKQKEAGRLEVPSHIQTTNEAHWREERETKTLEGANKLGNPLVESSETIEDEVGNLLTNSEVKRSEGILERGLSAV